MKKGSKEAKAWGRKMQRARKTKTKRKTKRKFTTRKRRTTKRKMKTLSGRAAYPRKRKSKKKDGWSNW